MNFKEFQQLALRTESKIDASNMDVEGIKKLLEMFIGVGNLLDYTKKGVFYKNYEKYDANFIELVDGLNGNLAQFVDGDAERKPVTDINFRIFHGLLGALTESSEIAMILLKYLETGEIDKANVGEEFSDSDWYKAIAYDELGLDEITTRTNVINKLRIRFPEKYSDEAAANRDLVAERTELEKNL